MLVPRAWSTCGQRNDVSSAGHSHHTAFEELSSHFTVHIHFTLTDIENVVPCVVDEEVVPRMICCPAQSHKDGLLAHKGDMQFERRAPQGLPKPVYGSFRSQTKAKQ